MFYNKEKKRGLITGAVISAVFAIALPILAVYLYCSASARSIGDPLFDYSVSSPAGYIFWIAVILTPSAIAAFISNFKKFYGIKICDSEVELRRLCSWKKYPKPQSVIIENHFRELILHADDGSWKCCVYSGPKDSEKFNPVLEEIKAVLSESGIAYSEMKTE